MDEQQLQTYLNLIQQLLTCSNEQVTEILQTNSEFVDQGLVETMNRVAQELAASDEPNKAHFLINLSLQLSRWLNKITANRLL